MAQPGYPGYQQPGQQPYPPQQGYPPQGYPPQQQYAPPPGAPGQQPYYPPQQGYYAPPPGAPQQYAPPPQGYYAPPPAGYTPPPAGYPPAPYPGQAAPAGYPPAQYPGQAPAPYPGQQPPPQQQYYAAPPPNAPGYQQQPYYLPQQPGYGPTNGVPATGGVYQQGYAQGPQVGYTSGYANTTSFYATTTPPLSSQQVSTYCNQLRTAMKGLGADHKTIISVLGNLTPEHAAQLDVAYKASFAKFLHEEVKSETSGNYGHLAVACCMNLADYDAKCLYDAMAGLGTDEDALIEILVGRTNAEMMAIKAAYARMYNKDLEKVVKSEVGGNFEKTLVVLLQAHRVETQEKLDPAADVQALYAAGEGRIGCDPLIFISILCNRSDAHLQQVYELYMRNHGKDITKVIKSETGHHLEKTLLGIVASTRDRPAYIAELIEKSMAGVGCNEHALTRLVARHRDPRVMSLIKAAYQRLYNKTLYARVQSETGHHFRELLVTIIKA
ncbi:hypothetical protein SmJEL517_g02777 [Synchytrium microbalum]|uniref:Annexin n=1 Tax=Synchytrium microbalum TaxID=1806994 RepID=A0A507C9T0_9FUNG|nr:uncharacterized protein SmJEL517_g02777 [Synchytrium microbalum]TPX34746.1 hypothetical protein SmJEL517_g02777 [Synchytrium microbalum]